ncbi:MAG: hypothetical protein II825_04395 [Paludibacteraceae bacterium]|nr:hypothetical protein [Paludibacteraceae bacterium]
MRTAFNERIVKILFIGLLNICYSTNDLLAINHGLCGDSIEWTLTDGILTFYGSGKMNDFDGFRPWREKKSKRLLSKKALLPLEIESLKIALILNKSLFPIL